MKIVRTTMDVSASDSLHVAARGTRSFRGKVAVAHADAPVQFAMYVSIRRLNSVCEPQSRCSPEGRVTVQV